MTDSNQTDSFNLDLTGRVLLDRYNVVGSIAEGGMGKVYLANDQVLSRKVVIKAPHVALLANRDFRAPFVPEIRALVRISHNRGPIPDGEPPWSESCGRPCSGFA